MTEIATEILALKSKKDGMLHVSDIYSWARRNRNSAVAQQLEWDDAKAGYQYRLDQIRRLIEVHIIYPETGARSVVSLTIDRGKKGGGYRELSAVLPNPSMRAVLLCQILDELDRTVRRYPQLAELASVVGEIDTTRRAIEGRSQPLAAD
jgi:hypothetical protein